MVIRTLLILVLVRSPGLLVLPVGVGGIEDGDEEKGIVYNV